MSSPTPPPLPDGTAPAAPPPMPGASGAPPVPPAAPPVPPATAPATPAAPALAPLDTTCPTCGATVAYAPGTTSLKCPSCGGLVPITGPVGEVHEHSYDDWAAAPHKQVASIGKQTLTCQGCGATTDTDELATRCQFCHGALVAVTLDKDLIAPEAVVPFHVDKKGSGDAFRKWVGSRRFAPNALKQIGSTEALAGTYVPHWTYDSHSETDYSGERGDYYYVEVPHQVSDGKGGTRTEMQQERRTRWSNAHGHVSRDFDDIVVPGSTTLPAKKLNKMGPWELDKAVSYRPEYLVGYSALRYDVDPDTGMETARGVMKAQIDSDVRSDIGGDEQRVSKEDISYSANMFKLVLMPLWIASYIYGGRTFQVMVNANTGEVIGDRPYSKAKIAIAILVTLLVLAIIIGVIVAAN